MSKPIVIGEGNIISGGAKNFCSIGSFGKEYSNLDEGYTFLHEKLIRINNLIFDGQQHISTMGQGLRRIEIDSDYITDRFHSTIIVDATLGPILITLNDFDFAYTIIKKAGAFPITIISGASPIENINNETSIQLIQIGDGLVLYEVNGDWIGIEFSVLNRKAITLQGQAMASDLNNSVTLYFGNNLKAPTLTQGLQKIQALKKGIIKRIVVQALADNAVPVLAWPMSLRLNGTDYLIQSVSQTGPEFTWRNDALNIPILETDWFEFKMVNPNWSANPNNRPKNVTFTATIFLET
jgi:hypothetical protein